MATSWLKGRISVQAKVYYLLQGTVLTLTPRTLAFGSQEVNTSSPTQSITVTNTGTAAVPITSVALAGTGAGQFAFTNGCGKSLAGKAKCIVKVAFKPTTKGAKSASLNVNGGGGGLRSTSLTGTGSNGLDYSPRLGSVNGTRARYSCRIHAPRKKPKSECGGPAGIRTPGPRDSARSRGFPRRGLSILHPRPAAGRVRDARNLY